MVCIYKDMVVHPVLGILTGAIVNPYELMTLQYKSMTYPYETPIHSPYVSGKGGFHRWGLIKMDGLQWKMILKWII